MALQPGDTVDRYRVEATIGHGGMAVVYRVRHVHLDTQHALKVLRIQNPNVVERLLQEGRVQASLRHPNIVAVTDVIEVHEAPGLVMEFIAGPTLEELIQQQHATVAETDLIGRGILAGVAFAHRKKLVHRDLKPGNILLAHAEDRLVPKICDFGLAKILGDLSPGRRQTKTGQTMGTPAFMPPEQIRDAKSADARSDVWSTGAILYELLSGRPAFDQHDVIDLFAAIAEGDYPPLEEVVRGVPQRMRAAIAGALAVEPAERFADATAMLAVWEGNTRAPVDGWRERTLQWADRSELVRPSEDSGAGTWQAPAAASGSGRRAAAGMGEAPFPQVQVQPDVSADDTWSTDHLALPTESLAPRDAPELPESTSRVPAGTTWGLIGVGLLGLLGSVGLAMLLVAGVVWWDQQRDPPEPTPVAAPEPAPEPVAEPEPTTGSDAPEPVVPEPREPEPVTAPAPSEPEPVVAPQPAVEPEPEPEPVVVPEPVATPEPVEPEPAEPEPVVAPEPASGGTPDPIDPDVPYLELSGIERAYLLHTDSGERVPLPGQVSMGSWEVRAAFDGVTPESAGVIRLDRAGRFELLCRPALRTCRLR